MYTAALSMRTVCIHRHSALKLHHRPARPRRFPHRHAHAHAHARSASTGPLPSLFCNHCRPWRPTRRRWWFVTVVVTLPQVRLSSQYNTCRIAKAQQRHSTTDGAADTRCCIPRDTPKYTWNSSVCVRATVNSERPHCAGEKRRVLPFLHSLTPCWLRDQQLRHGRTTA